MCAQQAVPPREVKVLPLFYVPRGEAAPTDDQATRLMRHLEWARTRYRELLHDQDTFTIAESKPRTIQSTHDLSFYRGQPERSAPRVASELLKELRYTRFNCPYILLVVMMNSADDFPLGGGRPFNGGYNTGGGILLVSSFSLDRVPNFQSTLQHALGHTFGLPHVDVYGYKMDSNDSLMSYNPRHHTKGFTPSSTPGELIPEDLRGLALNHRALPKLRFDPKTDIPPQYALAERIVPLGPMNLPNHPGGVQVTTESGEEFGSKVANIVQGQILPSKKAGGVTFDGNLMWQSAKTRTGWVTVEVVFPYEAELTRVEVHSQHSGQYHAAQAVRISVQGAKDAFESVKTAKLNSVDASVTLPKTKGQRWRFAFQAGKSGCVVLRGLRFFSGEDELFPPLVVYPS
jgi:hypothetical protein